MEKNLIMNIEEQRILKEINKRKLYIVGQKDGDIIGDMNVLNTNNPDVIPRVRLTENQRLIWPVHFLCPDHTIIILDFHEDATFNKMLVDIFAENVPWDAKSQYNPATLNIYYDISDNTATKFLKRVQPEHTLSNVLTSYRCPIKDGTPMFILTVIRFHVNLKLDLEDKQIRAEMHDNFSAAYYFLNDYGSSLLAAEEALKLIPNYEKAFLRAINCCINMKDFYKSLNYWHIYSGNKPEFKIIEMENLLVMKIMNQSILLEINKRKLNIVGQKRGDLIGDINILNTCDPDVIPRVRLTENQRLIWTVLFLCPDCDIRIILPDVHEDDTFNKMLVDLYSVRAPWNPEGEYNPGTINIYRYVSVKVKTTNAVLRRVHTEDTLSNVLTLFSNPIEDGLPIFVIASSGGQFENEH